MHLKQKKSNYKYSSVHYKRVRKYVKFFNSMKKPKCVNGIENIGIKNINDNITQNQSKINICDLAQEQHSSSSIPPAITTQNSSSTSSPIDNIGLLPDIFENKVVRNQVGLLSDDCTIHSSDQALQEMIQQWAVKYRITHDALNHLLMVLRKNCADSLPKNARTILKTVRIIKIMRMGTIGEYWHNGLERCLKSVSNNLKLHKEIDLCFNIDGLPINNSSKHQFWPILMSIVNLDNINPMIIGVYLGSTKPESVEEYLSPFVCELLQMLDNGGIEINGKLVKVNIKCFICDTPARAFVKGIVNFNHYHGCSKCTVIGEFHKSMSYPRIDCPLRSDRGFRLRIDPDHHKQKSPIERLPINMIDCFPIADSLHLIDLGIVKNGLLRWINGGQRNFNAKFSCRDIELISNYLVNCNQYMPSESHRAVRKLDTIRFWKGVEFRQFLFYLGPIILKDHLPHDAYQHFMLLFCATTICSANIYSKWLNVADSIYKEYIELHISLYGIGSITSNVHNLCHIVGDLKQFGNLSSISSYKFENALYKIKNLLRSGHLPLSQIAKRLSEISAVEEHIIDTCNVTSYPFAKKEQKEIQAFPNCNKIFLEIHLSDGIMFNNTTKDKWILTKSLEVVAMINATLHKGNLHILGKSVESKYDYFTIPFKSSLINIYFSSGRLSNATKLYNPHDIKCKLVGIKHKNKFIFIPLVHTLDLCN